MQNASGRVVLLSIRNAIPKNVCKNMIVPAGSEVCGLDGGGSRAFSAPKVSWQNGNVSKVNIIFESLAYATSVWQSWNDIVYALCFAFLGFGDVCWLCGAVYELLANLFTRFELMYAAWIRLMWFCTLDDLRVLEVYGLIRNDVSSNNTFAFEMFCY